MHNFTVFWQMFQGMSNKFAYKLVDVLLFNIPLQYFFKSSQNNSLVESFIIFQAQFGKSCYFALTILSRFYIISSYSQLIFFSSGQHNVCFLYFSRRFASLVTINQSYFRFSTIRNSLSAGIKSKSSAETC